MNKGKIYLVATPIGNLQDITLRALETLKNVDFIAAEDTRNSQKLLNHFQIKTKIFSYHNFNEKEASAKTIKLVLEGANVALISDAGMPLIADPGYFLIHQARKHEIVVEIIPGVSALTSAFALSGFNAPFTFIGFLKDKTQQRQSQLQEFLPSVYILYVAPHKLIATLKDINSQFQDYHQIFLVKELTKKFEKHFVGTARQILMQLPEVIKGEFTLCLKIEITKSQKVKTNKYAQFSKNQIN